MRANSGPLPLSGPERGLILAQTPSCFHAGIPTLVLEARLGQRHMRFSHGGIEIHGAATAPRARGSLANRARAAPWAIMLQPGSGDTEWELCGVGLLPAGRELQGIRTQAILPRPGRICAWTYRTAAGPAGEMSVAASPRPLLAVCPILRIAQAGCWQSWTQDGPQTKQVSGGYPHAPGWRGRFSLGATHLGRAPWQERLA